MGSPLLDYYKKHIKQEWKTAFFSAVSIFFLVHLYKITNTLPNHDSYFNVYSNQDMTRSGRWFLQFACGVSSFFDLDWLIGIFCAFWLGLTAVAITELFQLKNPFVIALTGAVLAACPSTTETLFFGFTADGYLMGLALAAASACLTCSQNTWRRDILGGACLCFCCAIYQSCVSFAIMLCICWLVRMLLENQISTRDAWRWIGRHVLIYGIAMAVYYLIWKLLLYVTGTPPSDYQGINAVGQAGLSTVLSGLVKSVTNLFFFFVEWNILEHPLTLYGALNILFLLCFAGIVIAAVVKSGILRRPGAMLLVVFALAASVPAISVWCFLSDGVQYRPMMLHSAVVYYIFAIILFERWAGARISTLFGLAMCIVVFNFSVMANISYSYLNYCRSHSYYEGIRMMDTIEEAQEACPEGIESILFIGSRKDEVALSADGHADSIHMLSMLIEDSLLYDDEHIYPYLTYTFELDIPHASDADTHALPQCEDIQELAAWPSKDCWTVIDNVLVINLEEQP